MDAIEKTGKLERRDIDIELLVENEFNPNAMSKREFDLLCDNIQQTGVTDPILVRPIEGGKYRIIGGHHRCKGARYLGFTQVPCTVITDPDFGDDAEKFQLVRMNTIKGKMSPDKFMNLYNQLKTEYEDVILQDMFGFAEEAEFKKLIAQTKAGLPKEMQKEFQAASKEIKTIEDLATVLNRLFATYGDTLDHGYMVFDFGGKENLWVRMSLSDKKNFLEIAGHLKTSGKCMDDFVSALLRGVVSDMTKVQALITDCPTIDKPTSHMATLDFID